MIYFDNAATTSPKPQSVVNAVRTALVKYSANPGRGGHKSSLGCSQMIYNTRVKISDFFNAGGAEKVVFTSSCTAALNTVIGGLFGEGDHIIISSLEHNAVSRSAYALYQRGGSFDTAEVSTDADETVENFKRKIRPNTRAIVCMHASNVFGHILPIKRLGELCREYGLVFAVDAAQSAGILDIDCADMNINYLCVAPHKGLYAPMGVGILITDERPRPLIYGGTGSMSVLQTQPDFTPDKYESGTVNVPGICGISAGIDFVKSKRNIYEHEMKIIRRIYDGLEKTGKVRFYTERPDERFVPVLSFNIGDEVSEHTAAELNKYGIAVRAGLHCAPTAHKFMGTDKQGTVRVAPSAFSDMKSADRLVHIVREYL